MRRKGMGHGKNRGRGARKRRRMTGFLQPCILVQLCRQDCHGYDLLKGLQHFVEDAEDHDPSIIYRLMRDMEDNGYVRSYEGEVSYGPQRRMYSITEDGKAIMKMWIQELQKARDEIDTLLNHSKNIGFV